MGVRVADRINTRFILLSYPANVILFNYTEKKVCPCKFIFLQIIPEFQIPLNYPIHFLCMAACYYSELATHSNNMPFNLLCLGNNLTLWCN